MDEFLTVANYASSVAPLPPLAPGGIVDASNAEVKTLHRKVEALAEENRSLKNEVASLKKRLAASAAVAGAPPSKKARTAGQKKKLFGKWSNALIKESRKHKVHCDMCAPDAYDITVKDAGAWSPAEFHELFDGRGVKIQPTPDNKPKAVVTILRFDDYDDVKRLFAEVGGEIEELGYEAQLWRKRKFGRSFHYDTVEARLYGMEVHYNRSTQRLSLVFSMVYGGLLKKREDSQEDDSSSHAHESD